MSSPAFIDNKSHRLVLGTSFRPGGSTAFHTAKYDFKPASVDNQREGRLEIGDGNEVTISLPNVPGSKTSCTVYKGNKRPVQKECVLIYDNITGEFTLERMASQIHVKKTRDSGNGNFSSNPTLHPVAPRLPKHNQKRQTKPIKSVKKSEVGTGIVGGKSKDLGVDNTPAAFQPSSYCHQVAAASEDLSADDGQSSDDNDSSSDAASSSGEDETLAPMPGASIFSSQLAADLDLSESDDSDGN